MTKKEEQAREYAKSRYGNNGHETRNEIAKVQACTVGYIAGWDACMKHLASLPLDESVNILKPTVRKSRTVQNRRIDYESHIHQTAVGEFNRSRY